MKVKYKQTDLDELAAKMEFGAREAFLEFGKDDGNGWREFEKSQYDLIERRYRRRSAPNQYPIVPLPAGTTFTPPTDAQVSAWLKICAACEFSKPMPNGALKCAHPKQTCSTCSQGTSGLAQTLKTYSFQCPLNLLTKL